MCSAFTPDCRYDKRIIKLLGNVRCPKKFCLDVLCVHKKDFSISRQKWLSVFSRQILVSGAEYTFCGKNKFVFLNVCSRDLCFWRDPKFNPRCYLRCLLSWKVLLKTKVCLCLYLKKEWSKLIRKSKIQSVLPCFELSFWGSKTRNFVVWRQWYVLVSQRDESWLQKRKPISFFEKFSRPITIKDTRICAIKGKNYFKYGIIVSTPHWLIQLTKNSLPFSCYTLWVCSKARWFLQSLTTVLRDPSTLDQIQLLWM